MKTPSRIEPLVADGLVDHVLRQLMSGKEAMVYVVQCGDELRCAKVYKEANKRGFHKAADYTEGRKVKNSRQARAMAKGSRYGRQEQEAAWQHAEVDALSHLGVTNVEMPASPLRIWTAIQDAKAGGSGTESVRSGNERDTGGAS